MAQCVQCEKNLPPEAQFCASCGAQVTASPAPSVDPYLGRVFAQKYRVEQLLGEGGMGRVYRAVQLSLDKVVCLKVLRRELASDPSIQARFQREARAASRLNHPNSIQVMDFGAAEAGELYLAMEYINGRDLQQLLTSEFPLIESRVCHIMAQVLDALSEAHAQHVIHRDLKPENVMVYDHRGDPDHVKVLDFGIAKIQDNDTQPKLTRAGLVCGTPEYMSPEQARGLELDARSDLYSAGVILYQMVTGALPFQSDSAVGFVTAHLNEQPSPPSTRRHDLSPALDDLILRTLSKNREERPASAKDMCRDLINIERGGSPAPSAQLGRPSLERQHPALTAPKLDHEARVPAHPVATPRSRLGLTLGLGLAGAVLASVAVAAYRYLPSRGPETLGAPAAGNTDQAGDSYKEGKTLYQQAFAENTDLEKRHALMDQALKQFYHSYLLDPTNPAPLKWMGNCYQDLGNRKAAISSFDRYVQAVPPPPDAEAVRQTMAGLKE